MGKKRVIHHGYSMGLASIRTFPKNYLLYHYIIMVGEKSIGRCPCGVMLELTEFTTGKEG